MHKRFYEFSTRKRAQTANSKRLLIKRVSLWSLDDVADAVDGVAVAVVSLRDHDSGEKTINTAPVYSECLFVCVFLEHC